MLLQRKICEVDCLSRVCGEEPIFVRQSGNSRGPISLEILPGFFRGSTFTANEFTFFKILFDK
jgi:hypothetical protein